MGHCYVHFAFVFTLNKMYISHMSEYDMLRSIPLREDKTEITVYLPIAIHKIAFFLVA